MVGDEGPLPLSILSSIQPPNITGEINKSFETKPLTIKTYNRNEPSLCLLFLHLPLYLSQHARLFLYVPLSSPPLPPPSNFFPNHLRDQFSVIFFLLPQICTHPSAPGCIQLTQNSICPFICSIHICLFNFASSNPTHSNV